MNKFHDLKRRVDYKRIKKELNLETSNNNNTKDSNSYFQSTKNKQ